MKFAAWYLNNVNFEPWVYVEDIFSDEECEEIKEYCKTLSIEKATTGSFIEDSKVDTNIRSNEVGWIDEMDDISSSLYKKLTDCINYLNQEYWNYNLEYISVLQYTKYSEKNDFYDFHVDIMDNGPHQRKLSFSLQLDDEDSYEGCDLLIKIDSDEIKTSRKKGSLNVFPSFLLHKVTPLQSGERNAIVGWVCGPSFK